MRQFFSILAIFVGFVVLVTMVSSFVNNFEIQECANWKQYEAQSLGEGLTSRDWQKDQCREHGIYLAY